MVDASKEVLDPARLAAVRATGLLDTGAEENFDRFASLAAMLLKAPFAFVTVVDERRSFWKSCIGIESDLLSDRQNAVEDSFCQYVVASGAPLIVGDTAADPRTADNPSNKSMGVAAWAGYPLLSPEGLVLGSFCVVDTVVRDWSDQDARVLETLASAASAEIKLRDASATAASAALGAQRSQDRLAFLAEVGDILATTGDAEVAVGLLAEHIVSALCDWCLITIRDEVTGVPRDIGRAHRDPTRMAELHRYADLHLVDSSAPSATVVQTGETIVIPVTEELITRSLKNPRAREALAALAPASTAVFPLRGRGEPFGSIAMVNGAERGRMTEGALSIAQELSRRAGLSLENARLHRYQRRISDTLQESMLTRPPQIDGLEIAVRYRPATEDAQVGGDWYDVFRQPDGSTMLVIGDVVGHDLGAISIMGQIRTMVRSIGYDRAASPAELLTRVDDTLSGLGVRTLCTAEILNLRPDSESSDVTVTWSSAGHPVPMMVTADGLVSEYGARPERLLGVTGSAVRHDHEQVLPTGATLLLMTDGLFERRARGYDESLSDLRAELSRLRGRGLEDLCDGLLAALAPARVEDDIALIAVRVVSARS